MPLLTIIFPSAQEQYALYFQHITKLIQSLPQLYSFSITNENKLYAPLALNYIEKRFYQFGISATQMYSALHLYQYLMRAEKESKLQQEQNIDNCLNQVGDNLDYELCDIVLYLSSISSANMNRLQVFQKIINTKRTIKSLKLLKFKQHIPNFYTILQIFIQIIKKVKIDNKLDNSLITKIIYLIQKQGQDHVQNFQFLLENPIYLANKIYNRAISQVCCAPPASRLCDILMGNITSIDLAISNFNAHIPRFLFSQSHFSNITTFISKDK